MNRIAIITICQVCGIRKAVKKEGEKEHYVPNVEVYVCQKCAYDFSGVEKAAKKIKRERRMRK